MKLTKFHLILVSSAAVFWDVTQRTGSPSSLVTVRMTLRNGVVIRVCMEKISIVRNSSKLREKIIKSTYLFLLRV